MRMVNDVFIWEKFKSGDRAAFELIIKDNYNALFTYGKKLHSDRDALKDCIHDLFTLLWERRAFLGDTDQIRPYLLRNLRNRILKEKQRNQNIDSTEKSIDLFHYTNENVESEIIATEDDAYKKKQIRHILLNLTPRQREIIHLKFYENLNNEHIAIVMAITPASVANLLHITLRLFKDKWETLLFALFFILLFP